MNRFEYEEISKEYDLMQINSTLWQEESYQFGKEYAYLNGTIQFNSTVSKEFIENVQNVALLRITLAGYRLANTLTQLFKDHPRSIFDSPFPKYFTLTHLIILVVAFSAVFSIITGLVVFCITKKKYSSYQNLDY